MIDWKPIDTIAPEMKDGREVLVYDPDVEDRFFSRYFIATWHSGKNCGYWVSTNRHGDEEYPEPTYWAELEPPSPDSLLYYDIEPGTAKPLYPSD